MLKNAMGKKRWRLHKALLILASLTMMLAAAAPALTQESNTATEASQEPEVTPYQHDTPAITNEAPGDDPAPSGIDSDASHMGEADTVYEGTPGPVIEGDSLDITGQDALPQGRQPDPGPGQSPGDITENQPDVALKAVRAARQAAQEAWQASDTAQLASQAVQQSTANPEEAQAAQEAAREAQQASDAAESAAQAAQLAATREDAQAAQEAAQEAQQASGAAESAAQAVQQALERATGTGVKDVFSRALQAARSAEAGGNNAAFAAEGGPGRVGADPGKASSGRTASEAAKEDAVGDKGIAGKNTANEAELKEDASEAESNTAASSVPTQGGVPLFLSGGTLLAAGVFVALKAFRSWFRTPSIPGIGIIRPLDSRFEGGSDEKDQGDLDSYRRSEEKERRFTAPGV